jgi:hypothetical protein
MDDREPGFILYHRRLYSSPVFRSLTKGQRWVLLSVLVLANFRRKPLGYFGGELIHVERGELAHEVEKIAAHAEETYATARKAIEKMLSFGFLEVRWSFGAHNRVRILRVVNYERYQGVAQQANNESSDDRATTAQQPHNERTREQGEQPTAAAAPARILPVGTHIQGSSPLLYDLVGRVEFGIALGRSAQPWGQAEALLGQVGIPAAVAALNEAAPNSDGYPGAVPIRFVNKVLADALRQGRKVSPPKPALPAPDEEWLASLGPRRAEVERKWAARRDAILRTVWPDKHAEFLSREIENLKGVIAEEEAA